MKGSDRLDLLHTDLAIKTMCSIFLSPRLRGKSASWRQTYLTFPRQQKYTRFIQWWKVLPVTVFNLKTYFLNTWYFTASHRQWVCGTKACREEKFAFRKFIVFKVYFLKTAGLKMIFDVTIVNLTSHATVQFTLWLMVW